MLKGAGLTKAARKRLILDDVSFEIPAGSTATVLGPSGSGKTTLLRTIMGLDLADSGELHFDGQRLAGEGVHVAPEKRQMSLVFQEFTLFPNLDVTRNLTFGLDRPGDARELVGQLLELLEIAHLRKRRIDKLSGGEQQRVALARALAVRPRVLLMDEPFSNIDNMLRERLYARLKAFLADNGMTTLIATHDHKEAFYFSDRIFVLKDGRLIDHNSPQRIYQSPANAWAAEFFGETNILSGDQLQPLAPHCALNAAASYLVRPEALDLLPAGDGAVDATVAEVVYYGAYWDVSLGLDSGLDLRVRCLPVHTIGPGDRVGVRLHNNLQPHELPASGDDDSEQRA